MQTRQRLELVLRVLAGEPPEQVALENQVPIEDVRAWCARALDGIHRVLDGEDPKRTLEEMRADVTALERTAGRLAVSAFGFDRDYHHQT